MFIANLYVALTLTIYLPGEPNFTKDYLKITQFECIKTTERNFKSKSIMYTYAKAIGVCKPHNLNDLHQITVTCIKDAYQNGCEVR